VTETRDKAAALKFIKKAMKRHGGAKTIVTDRLRSYGAALGEITAADLQQTSRRLNNTPTRTSDRRSAAVAEWRLVMA